MGAHRPRKLDVKHVIDLAELYAKVIDHDVILKLFISLFCLSSIIIKLRYLIVVN